MRAILFISLLTLLASCTTVKRYKSIDRTIPENPIDEPTADYDESKLKVTMRMSEVKIDPEEDKPTSKTLWDLQGQGQKELLQSLNTRFKGNDKYLSQLSNTYLKSDDKIEPVIDLTKRKVKFVFTIQRWHPYEQLGGPDNGFSLADRIEYLRYSLDLDDPALHFLNWNQYSTEYGSINVADVSFQQSLSVTAGYGDTSTGGVSATGSLSKSENQHLQYRYVQLNGSLQKDRLDLESEGTREIDLSGNVIVEVTMQFTPFQFPIFEMPDPGDDGAFKKPKDADIVTIIAKIPAEQNVKALTGHLSYTYAYRHVKNKSKTFFEWDDNIQYYTGKVTKKVTILLPEDVMPGFFGIIPLGGDIGKANQRLKIADPTGVNGFTETDLTFGDQLSATDFLEWLTQYPCAEADLNSPIRFKNHLQLNFEGKPLTRQKVNSLIKDGKNLIAAKYFPNAAAGDAPPGKP
jgi:hypothetical protein